VREIADLPLAEDIPVAFDSCRKGPRGIEWRDDKPAEVGGWVGRWVGGCVAGWQGGQSSWLFPMIPCPPAPYPAPPRPASDVLDGVPGCGDPAVAASPRDIVYVLGEQARRG